MMQLLLLLLLMKTYIVLLLLSFEMLLLLKMMKMLLLLKMMKMLLYEEGSRFGLGSLLSKPHFSGHSMPICSPLTAD